MDINKLLSEFVPDNICNKVQCSLLSYRGLCNTILDYPENFINKIFNNTYDGEYIYYPCDLLELSNVVSQNSIFNTGYLAFLNFNLSKELMTDYSLLVKIKIEINKDNIFGGLYFIDDSKLKFNKEDIQYVYLRNDKLADSIKELGLECGPLNYTFANKKESMQKFAQNQENIQLTTLENKIFSFIITAKNHFPQTKNATVRRSGGWVRDKILGEDSDDIDCVVNYVGVDEFVQYLKKYDELIGTGKVTGSIYSTSLDKVGNGSSANIVALSIFGQMVEFVNPRV